MILWLVLAILVALPVPLILDWLYGTGLPGTIYNNHFSAESWFSFLGSYLPSILIGFLTIYQQHIIRDQDQQYKKLLKRYLYTPDRNAEVFRYSSGDQMIGEWKYYNFKASLKSEQVSVEFNEEWKSGYILTCSVHNTETIGIKDIYCTAVEWAINSEKPYQVMTSAKIKTCWKSAGDARYIIYIFWTFQDTTNKTAKEIAEEVALCMNNHCRKDPDYFTSYILLKVTIINEENVPNNMNMKFKMQSSIHENDPYKLQSVEEHYYPV